MAPLLQVDNLRVQYPIGRKELVRAVDGVSLTVASGEAVGLVGESGCGKTTLGRAIIRLVEPASGEIHFNGKNITHVTGAVLRKSRREFQMIFQDPYSSLNPRMRVEDIIGEALDIHGLASTRAARCKRVEQLLADVGLEPM